MANQEVITIPIDLPRDEATAFAALLKRTSYDDCLRRSNRNKKYSDGREEADVMWAGLRLVETQFNEAGLCPRGRSMVARTRPQTGLRVTFVRNGRQRAV